MLARTTHVAFLGAALICASCYSAELDTDVSSVFVCAVDEDCSLGHSCDDGLCRNVSELEGPILEILDPALLHVFDPGVPVVPLSLRGENLVLTATPGDLAQEGYIEVYLDGVLVDAVTQGDLGAGIEVPQLSLPEEGGLHHIVLLARKLGGDRFDNPESSTHVAFWVDDGEEHVGIISPAPDSRVQLGTAEVAVEIAALNFTFVNPGFMSPDEATQSHQGYVHLFVDADVPTCLPACNFDYQTSIIPRGLERVNRLTAEQGLLLPEGVGTVRLQIVAQTTTSAPYYRQQKTTELVYDEVPVESILGVEQ